MCSAPKEQNCKKKGAQHCEVAQADFVCILSCCVYRAGGYRSGYSPDFESDLRRTVPPKYAPSLCPLNLKHCYPTTVIKTVEQASGHSTSGLKQALSNIMLHV